MERQKKTGVSECPLRERGTEEAPGTTKASMGKTARARAKAERMDGYNETLGNTLPYEENMESCTTKLPRSKSDLNSMQYSNLV